MRKVFALASACVFALVASVSVAVAEKEVTIGYQLVYNPWKVAIADKKFEAATGYKINWKKFNSGAKVISAMASGDVHIALAGSSPIAAGVSRGLPITLFWITENINDAEAMVVRNGSGVKEPKDLKGKRIGVPFVSTTHFHTLFALEQWGIDSKEVKLLNMQPNAIAAAWERGDIDAAFVWDPALGRIKKSGKVLVTSGDLAKKGKATFDGMVVHNDFAKDHKAFMCQFVKTIAAADSAYRDNPADFGPDSDNAKKIVKLVGGKPEDVPGVLALYEFPTLESQLSSAWLGGGKDGGAAKALFFTSEFLKSQKKVDKLLPDYGAVVTDAYAKAAKAGC
ncbi:MAG: taurine ABC transporter substrate-binding protein [Hyphomicrobiales bacterium]|nr:taurine ABC transporter substrate-binding protein [Hyphomicrobiales bacterium]